MRRRTNAFGRPSSCEVGAAARLAGAERRKRRTSFRGERREEARLLLRAAAEQYGKQAQQGAEQGERDVHVDGIKFLCQDCHVEHAGALAAEGRRDEAAQEAGLDHLLVEGPRRREALKRSRQIAGRRPDPGEHVAREGPAFVLQAPLLHGQREVYRHGPIPLAGS